jgi:hypothetical protein
VFFKKAARSDIWVISDHVTHNPSNAAFWERRVKVLMNVSETWLSISLRRSAEKGSLGVAINEMQINLLNSVVRS